MALKSSQGQEILRALPEICRSHGPDGVVRSRIKRYALGTFCGLPVKNPRLFGEFRADPSFLYTFPDSCHDDDFDDRILPDTQVRPEEGNSIPQCDQQGQLHVMQFVCVSLPGGLHLRSCQPDSVSELPSDRHQSLHRLPDVLSLA